MKLLALVHMYPPRHLAGAELMLHSLFRGLMQRGHECRVATTFTEDSWEYSGVQVTGIGGRHRRLREAFEWCDIAITHLDLTQLAVSRSELHQKPLVHLVHNDRQLVFNKVRDASLVVFNSRWLQQAVKWDGPSIVVHPPVFSRDYLVQPGECVTLVNVNPPKGSGLFWALARELPHHKFLAVRGAYGHQDIPRKIPPNAEVWEQTLDMRSVYAKTALILMPSSYESFGRVALEAAMSSIPSICHPTPGLLESMGGGATFLDRADFGSWLKKVDELMSDPQAWSDTSHAAVLRARQHDPEVEIDKFDKAIQGIVEIPKETAAAN